MDKIAEFKDLIYDIMIEKKAFYNRKGMKKGYSAFNRGYSDTGLSKSCLTKMASQLSTQERKSLPDSMFGIPEQKRFPMPDQIHVRLAWRSVNKANITEGEKVKLRQRILARAKALGMDTKGWSNV